MTCLAVSISCVLILAALVKICEPLEQQGGSAGPQILWDIGPVKIGAAYKETKLEDRLKLNKMEMNFFLSNSRTPSQKHLGTIAQREDLIRCKNFLPLTPEMESLVDCKPIEEQALGVSATTKQDETTKNYVKRTTLSIEGKLDFLPFLEDVESRGEVQFYPLKTDFTEQSIKRILKRHDMERGLGFGPYSSTWGFFVRVNLTESGSFEVPFPTECTANMFISINQTQPITTDGSEDTADQQPELWRSYEHMLNGFKRNGGFVSVQEAFCETLSPGIEFESDFTFIHRKQFPYLTLVHNLTATPASEIWNCAAWINQTKLVGETDDEAYTTESRFVLRSSLSTNLNLILSHNVTNLNSSTGSDRTILAHPYISGFNRGSWSVGENQRVVKPFSLTDFENEDGPENTVIYNDDATRPFISLSFVVDRKMFHEFLARLIRSEEEQRLRDLAAALDGFMPVLRKEIFNVIAKRDEL